jgi:hypothetical protein
MPSPILSHLDKAAAAAAPESRLGSPSAAQHIAKGRGHDRQDGAAQAESRRVV